ncbi:MAG TPA: hypothetical protein VGQ83_36520 [Polyangia bacterium]|jgi:hypothetical protein
MRPVVVAALVALTAAAAAADLAPVDKTVVRDARAKQQLVGAHRLSLQWIGWKKLGRARVREEDGVLRLSGEQFGQSSAGGRAAIDTLRVWGSIVEVRAKEFVLRGTITTQVSTIAGGRACTRSGDFTFALRGTRKYWRLQQMQNPCEDVLDYVDLYLR